MRGRWVHSGAPLGSLGSSAVVGFNLVRLGDRWVHSGAPWGSFSSYRVVGFTRVRPEGRWVHIGARLGSMGDHWVSLGSSGVVGFTWVRPGGVSVYAGSMVFTRVYPGGRWVHPVPLGSLRCTQGVVGFNLGRWVNSGAPWVSLDS